MKAYMAGNARSVWNKSMNHDTYYVIIKLKAFKEGFKASLLFSLFDYKKKTCSIIGHQGG